MKIREFKNWPLIAKIIVGFELVAGALILARLLSPESVSLSIHSSLPTKRTTAVVARSEQLSTPVMKSSSVGTESVRAEATEEYSAAEEGDADFKRGPQFLQRFLELDDLALRRANDTIEYQQLLQDELLIQETQNLLMAPPLDVREDSAEARDQRIFAINYFQAALEWTDNPSRAAAIQAIASIVTQNPLLSIRDENLQQNLIGDRVELFQIAAQFAPEAMAKIVQKLDNEAAEEIYTYAMANDIARMNEQGEYLLSEKK